MADLFELDGTCTLQELRRIRGEDLRPVPVPAKGTVIVQVKGGGHGTRRKYEYGKCRCDACKAANAAHKRKYA